jgi:hypothetical protein
MTRSPEFSRMGMKSDRTIIWSRRYSFRMVTCWNSSGPAAALGALKAMATDRSSVRIRSSWATSTRVAAGRNATRYSSLNAFA